MNQKRPVNLDLTSLKYPPMAIVSILHRISGLILFILLPVMLYLLGMSLRSTASFQLLQNLLVHPFYKLMLWGFSAALGYHLLAGIRHLALDMGWGEGLCAGRRSAVTVIVLAVILTIALGIWIW
ncbi:succinate dehydrogenase, cytochrome b556 subunit [Legionella septentrionalis]|uniref:succinate dehydrogenase, cytochrome b556 subunit n=1 Tax=Legionella septentrionalis TaxID=2498109 RepID=UPI000F8E71FE|nr:succinate dehydrogenase, cytochrome b556 subunit [Legionella septentrionalis]RUR00061.1 succinate dehydrogenase, cytochrome b556 subunit [Legionella septentrionalis]